MYTYFRNKDIKKLCEDSKYAQRMLGKNGAEQLGMRMGAIAAFDNLAELILYKSAHCHGLRNDRQGQFAVNVIGGKRLVFEPVPASPDLKSITEVEIIEVIDYH